MQTFQSWKPVVPALTSRIANNFRPQLRTTSWILSNRKQISLPRTYSSYNKSFSLFSSTPAIRPVTTTADILSPPSNTYKTPITFNQIRSFSASASLAGKRATYNPSRRVQKRRHGFLARLRSRTGRMILKRRQLKGRKKLSW